MTQFKWIYHPNWRPVRRESAFRMFVCLLLITVVGSAYAQSNQLNLFNTAIVSAEVFTATQTITIGPDVRIESSGKATFGAPNVYILSDLKIVAGGSMYITPQTLTVGINSPQDNEDLSMVRAYPNPFAQAVQLTYSLGHAGEVNIRVVDMFGKEVKTLISEFQLPGKHRIAWDGNNESGIQVANGMYSMIISVGNVRVTEKVVLLR